MKQAAGEPTERMKITLSMSRAAQVALERIRAKRLEGGANLREIRPSRLIDEAVEMLRRKEGV